MRFLILHGEKAVCGIIVVLCGVWIGQSLRGFGRPDLVPVRIEVQRGPAADRIDHPVHAFELGSPTDSATKTVPNGGTKDLARTPVAAPHRVRRGGAQERSRQTTPQPVWLHFEDTDVKALQTFHYRVRLVARLREDLPLLPAVVFEDGKEIPLQLAEDLERIQDPAAGTTLYAGPVTQLAKLRDGLLVTAAATLRA